MHGDRSHVRHGDLLRCCNAERRGATRVPNDPRSTLGAWGGAKPRAMGVKVMRKAKLVVGQGMTVVVIGVVAGIAIAVGVTRLMTSLPFNVGAGDPVTFAAR